MQEMPKAKKMKWSQKKNPYKIGDHVLFEWNGKILKGFIRNSDGFTGEVEIGYPKQENYYAWLCWRQCKKLVKKPPLKEFWIEPFDNIQSLVAATIKVRFIAPIDPWNWIHVREVRKKK